MPDPPEPDCWLLPGLELRPSPIDGLGLFTPFAIPAGTAVSRLGGRLVPTRELEALIAAAAAGEQYVDSIAVGEDLHLVLPAGTPNGRANHSCDPSMWWIDAYTLVTSRDVAAGAELTSDYATSTGRPAFSMDCSCSSRLCRGAVSGGDWQRAELRERYAEHWVPPLLARIAALRASDTPSPTG